MRFCLVPQGDRLRHHIPLITLIYRHGTSHLRLGFASNVLAECIEWPSRHGRPYQGCTKYTPEVHCLLHPGTPSRTLRRPTGLEGVNVSRKNFKINLNESSQDLSSFKNLSSGCEISEVKSFYFQWQFRGMAFFFLFISSECTSEFHIICLSKITVS